MKTLRVRLVIGATMLLLGDAFGQDMTVTANLSFGNVELGLRVSTLVRIENTRSTAFTISSIGMTAITGASSQWDYPTTTFSLSPGGITYIKISFVPNVEGLAEAQFTLNSPDSSPPVLAFSGTGVPAAQLNSIVLIDRSRSMERLAYQGVTKIDAARKAAGAYFDLVRADDKIGIFNFNYSVSESPPYGSRPASRPPILEDAAITTSSLLKPEDGTNIGGALNKAFEKLPYASATQSTLVILISDGVESNKFYYKKPRKGWPYSSYSYSVDWDDLPPALDAVMNLRNDGCLSATNHGVTSPCLYGKNIRVYSIAVGNDADQRLMRELSLASGVQDGFGYHYIDSESSGNYVTSFAYKISAHAKGYSIVRDPVVNVNLAGNKPIEIQSVSLTSSDIAASLFIADDSAYRQYYTYELRNAKGAVFSPQKERKDGSVAISDNSALYDINRVKGNEDGFDGTWKLFLIPNGKCEPIKPTQENVDARSCIVPITFAASVKSNLKLEASVQSSKDEPGGEITLMAQATEDGLPIEIRSITVDARAPGSRQIIPITLVRSDQYEKGKPSNPTYNAKFNNTANEGSYQFTFYATIKNNKGQVTTREELRFLPMMHEYSASGGIGIDEGEGASSQPWLWLVGTLAISIIVGGGVGLLVGRRVASKAGTI